MVHIYTDVVDVTNEDTDLKEFLQQIGLSESAVAHISAAQLETLRATLKEIAGSENNTAGGGGVSTIVGNLHFRLRKTIFAGLTATATCVASVLSHNPAAMLAAGMGALQTMRALVTRLSDVELEVCVAISEIMRVRQSEGFSRLGATQEEVVARMRQDAPANLHDIIVKLTGGSSPVLKTDVDGGVTRYSVS